MHNSYDIWRTAAPDDDYDEHNFIAWCDIYDDHDEWEYTTREFQSEAEAINCAIEWIEEYMHPEIDAYWIVRTNYDNEEEYEIS